MAVEMPWGLATNVKESGMTGIMLLYFGGAGTGDGVVGGTVVAGGAVVAGGDGVIGGGALAASFAGCLAVLDSL